MSVFGFIICLGMLAIALRRILIGRPGESMASRLLRW